MGESHFVGLKIDKNGLAEVVDHPLLTLWLDRLHRFVERYKTQADKVRAQFGEYTVIDTLHVNGSLTLGENLADLGGLAVAYAAMEKAYAQRPRTKLEGFTPEQRFFLGWARVWRNLQTNEDLRTQVQTDPHAPAKWRINGPLSNLPEFRAAWGCQDADPMVRPAGVRAKIW